MINEYLTNSKRIINKEKLLRRRAYTIAFYSINPLI